MLDRGLEVLHLYGCGLCDRLTMIEMRRLLTAQEAEAETQTVERRRLEVSMPAPDADVEALCVAYAQVEELMVERDILTAGAEQATVKHNELAARIRKLEVDEKIRDGELRVVFSAVR